MNIRKRFNKGLTMNIQLKHLLTNIYHKNITKGLIFYKRN